MDLKILATDTIKNDPQRKTWVGSSAFGKIYDIKNFSSEEELLNDLKICFIYTT